jgi:hypothetical protein
MHLTFHHSLEEGTWITIDDEPLPADAGADVDALDLLFRRHRCTRDRPALWSRRRSTDQAPRTAVIALLAAAVRDLGHTVAFDIEHAAGLSRSTEEPGWGLARYDYPVRTPVEVKEPDGSVWPGLFYGFNVAYGTVKVGAIDPDTGEYAGEKVARPASAVRLTAAEEARLSVERAEADRAAEAAWRIQRHTGYQENAAKRAEGLYARVDGITAHIPLGQPILPGHRSAKHARRHSEQIDNLGVRARQEERKAACWKGRIASAEQREHDRQSLPGILARLDEFAAEARRIDRERAATTDPITRADLDQDAADIQARTEWQQARADALTAAGEKLWGPQDFQPGDLAKDRSGIWHPVHRVNGKSLTVVVMDLPTGPPLTRTIPYRKITDQHRPQAKAT